MDLFCPHCSKRVTVTDDKSGQVTNCPLCTKPFMAPALAPSSVAAPPPPPPPLPPPVSTVPTYAPPVPITPHVAASGPVSAAVEPPPPVPSEASAPTPAPPPPPGDYTRLCTCRLGLEWLRFIPPACVALILFVLSFFNWGAGKSLWGMSFSTPVEWQLTTYTILMFPCFLFAVIAAVLDVAPTPPSLGPVVTWKNLPVGLFLGLAFLFLAGDYLYASFAEMPPHYVHTGEVIAIRLHFLAILASAGLFWLQLRRKKNLPPPKLVAHW